MPPTAAQALVLGILQGLTEFLPVSSSAHLILLPRFLQFADPGLAFDVALHLGTLGGVVAYFWKDLWRLVAGALSPANPTYKEDRRLIGFLLVATLPGAIAGFLLEHKAETAFRSPQLIAVALMVMGLALALADWFRSGERSVKDIGWGAATAIGLAQGLALIPGVSRSGSTITAGLLLGLRRTEAARFSFLLSVPIIAGAGLMKVKQILMSPDKIPLIVGFWGAALSGLIAISILMKYVQTRRYTPFVIYRWALGLFILFNLSKFQ